MKVIVKKVVSLEPEVIVLCRTEYGKITLHWIEGIPIEEKEYQVELETEQILVENINILNTKEAIGIYDSDKGVKLIGIIESLDEDGYLVLRIGQSIIAFITKELQFAIGSRIEIKLDYLNAYPFEY